MANRDFSSVVGEGVLSGVQNDNLRRKKSIADASIQLGSEIAKTTLKLQGLDRGLANYVGTRNVEAAQLDRSYNLGVQSLTEARDLGFRETQLNFDRTLTDIGFKSQEGALRFQQNTALQQISNQLALLGTDQSLAQFNQQIAQAGFKIAKTDNLISLAQGQIGFQNQVLDIIGDQGRLNDLSRDLAFIGNESQEERLRTEGRLRTYNYLNSEGAKRAKRTSASFFADSGVFGAADLDAASLEFAGQMATLTAKREQVAIQREQIAVRALQTKKSLERQEIGVKSNILNLKSRISNLRIGKQAVKSNIDYYNSQKDFVSKKRGIVQQRGELKLKSLADFNNLQKRVLEYRKTVAKMFKELSDDKLESKFTLGMASIDAKRMNILESSNLKFQQRQDEYAWKTNELNKELNRLNRFKTEALAALKEQNQKAQKKTELEKRVESLEESNKQSAGDAPGFGGEEE